MSIHFKKTVKKEVDDIEKKLDVPDNFKADLSGVISLLDDIEGKLDAWPAERGTDNAELEANALARYNALGVLIGAIPTTPELEASALARYNVFKTVEFEKCQSPPSENAAVTIAVTTADQSLGAKDITVDIPAGATIISVIALARINIMNNSATAQKIDLKFNVEGVTLFNQTDVVGLGGINGTSAGYVIAEDASDEVTADGQVVTLEAKITLSAAASVRFQAQYYLFITYKMG